MARPSGPACAPAPTGSGAARWPRVLEPACAATCLGLALTVAAQPAPAPAPADRPDRAALPASEPEWRYRIAPGDTLIALAATYLARPDDWPRLQRLNAVADPRRLVPGSRLRMPYAWLKREAAVAEVVFLQGAVRLQRPGAAAGLPLAVGTQLQVADALHTGPQSALSLRFADGSRLLIGPDSRVSIEQLLVYGRSGITESRLRVEAGSADTAVRPDTERAPVFQIRTPAINLGVRGTEFRVRVDGKDAASRVEVLEGSVGAQAGQSAQAAPVAGAGTLVAAGFGVLARPNEPLVPPRPLLAPPRLASLGSPIEYLPVTLQWPAVDGASGYRAQVFGAERGDALLLDALFAGSPARWSGLAELPDGDYRLRLRALDAVGIEGRHAELPFALRARPVAPALQWPVAGALFAADQVPLRWQPLPEPMRYRVQVAGPGGFGAPLLDRALEANDAALALPPGVFHWRVAAIGAAAPTGAVRQGPFGPPQTFELRAPPPLPALEQVQLSPAALLLRWKALAAGQGLQLQIADNARFEPVLVDHATWASQVQLARPPAGRYHLRIRSLIGDAPVGEFNTPVPLDVPALPWWERIWLSAADARP